MWESYCRTGGVRIKTTLRKLDELFTSGFSDCRLFIKKVYYESSERYDSLGSELIYTLFMKRIPFRHETEYRYILVKVLPDQEKIISVRLNNLLNIIDEILVAPALTSNRWIAITIYKIGVKLSPDGGNIIDGKQFCRISQLYGNISQEISDIDDANW